MGNNSEKTYKSKSKKHLLIILFSLVVVAIVTCAITVLNSNSLMRTYQNQLELGHRYFEDLEYEQAIAAFEEAIKIEPKNAEGYLGLADVYLAMGDMDKAIDVLERGYDETDDDVFLERINGLKTDDVSNGDMVVQSSQTNQQIEDWRVEFADLKEMYSEYLIAGRGGYVRSCCDWKLCFLTVDELQEAYDPLISRMEDYLAYKENHVIPYQDEYEYFEDYLTDYTIREFYIITHQFEKSGKNPIGHTESEDGYISDFDEYNREVYFERKPEGNYDSFVWGDDGCVASYTTVYTSDRDYYPGTVEEWNFQYDNGRIISAHFKQTSGENGNVTEIDFVYSYDGDTVTESFIHQGNVDRTIVYAINKFGGGTVINDSYDDMEW